MYSRLYTDVLNRHHWVESCNTINHSYKDSGLFGISASLPPIRNAHDNILAVICDQLINATTDISDSSLSRAKNQLKSSLLMSLESKLTLLEDIARQILFFDKRIDALEICNRIDSVTCNDIKRAAARIIYGANFESGLKFDGMNKWTRTGDGNPTLVVYGNLGKNDPLYKAADVIKEWGVGR